MSRETLFRHYAKVGLAVAVVGSSVIVMFVTADRIPLIGSLFAAVLGFSYFVQQQKLAETALFKDLFTEFNRRYDALNEPLSLIDGTSEQLKSDQRQTIVDYFNLCSEEYLFFLEGYILRAAWRSWCAGMLCYFEREPFRSVWTEECKTNSYYGLSVDAIKRGAK